MWWSLISKLEGQVWSKESGDIFRPTFVLLPKVEVHLYNRRANQHSCSSAVCYENHKTFCRTANAINTLSKQSLNLIMHFSCLGYEFRMNLTVLRFLCTNLTGLFTISDTKILNFYVSLPHHPECLPRSSSKDPCNDFSLKCPIYLNRRSS